MFDIWRGKINSSTASCISESNSTAAVFACSVFWSPTALATVPMVYRETMMSSWLCVLVTPTMQRKGIVGIVKWPSPLGDWCQKSHLLLLLLMLCCKDVFIFTFMTPVSIVKGSLLCNFCHRMFHMNCLYTSQMDNLLLYHWLGFLDSFLACWVLMSLYIGIHSNTKFKGQELMEFKSWMDNVLVCHL